MPALNIYLIITLLSCALMSGCSTTAEQQEPEVEQTTETTDDDRGFDPCLINPALAVCASNDKSH